ncbi:hypothetical protein J6590_047307 [Homalodisca vitripennis]|nr:hypothetical protein J6590_047307 [Homalodisca vitripennis]
MLFIVYLKCFPLVKDYTSVDAKTATAEEGAFCVFEYGISESTTVVQRAFRTKYSVQPVSVFNQCSLQCLEVLENWLFPQLEQDALQFIFQQDGAPPNRHLSVHDYLNPTTEHFITGLQEALTLNPCNFLWGYATIDDLKQEITTAIQTVTPDMLLRVWYEFEYRVDIACVSGVVYIEHLCF